MQAAWLKLNPTKASARARYFKDEIAQESWWNIIVLCFYLCVFLQLIYYKVSYCWMNMFKFVVWLKGSHLKFFIPETQGPIKHLTYYLLCFCQNGELGQPNMWRTKLKLVKESFKNWLYFALSIIIQASYKHCWKSQLEYPLACQKC